MKKEIAKKLEEYNRYRDMTKALEKRWVTMFLHLLEFQKNNGHVNVPAKYMPFQSLGYWVRRQRLVYHQGKMDPLRENLLLLTGFNFRMLEFHDWQVMFQKLQKFKKKFGHVQVTEGYQDSQLHNWLVYQRKLYWHGKLKYSKLEKLKALGADMRNKTINRWDDKFSQLVSFKKKYGHLHICKSFGADDRLINFAKGIRRSEKRLSKSQKRKLDKLGFDWNPEKHANVILNKKRGYEHWLQRFKELEEYKQKFSTSYISTTSNTHKSLANWISVQRNNYSNLSKEQITLLESIDFFKDQKKNSYRNRG